MRAFRNCVAAFIPVLQLYIILVWLLGDESSTRGIKMGYILFFQLFTSFNGEIPILYSQSRSDAPRVLALGHQFKLDHYNGEMHHVEEVVIPVSAVPGKRK